MKPLKRSATAAETISQRSFNVGLRVLTLLLAFPLMSAAALGADRIQGKVQSGSGPIANSDVSLWEAGPDAPQMLAEAKTKADGSFELTFFGKKSDEGVLYLIASGGSANSGNGNEYNPAIVLMATLGTTAPQSVTVNELTTVASVWTGAQLISGDKLCGNSLSLRIAAGNVPNLVDLQTGGLGPVIQDPLNSSQTTTLAKFNTLGNLISVCIQKPEACQKLFATATAPGGPAPTNTLSALQNIARKPGHNAEPLFTLFKEFCPVPEGKRWREATFIPYLSFAPRAWTLSLVYAGGGLNSPGGIAIDREGNMWADLNFVCGSQSTVFSGLGGGLGELAPNGRPISPMTVGFRGGGIDNPGFGIAISGDDKVWATSLDGKTISVFDRKTGKSLSPESGYNFGGKLGSMQGIMVTPDGDVWACDNGKSQLVYLPKGDASKGRILGTMIDGKPVDGNLTVKAPFHLAIDQQDRVWVTNSGSNTVVRFPAKDPRKAEEFTVGYAPRAIAIDSQGNAWVCNTVGHPDTREKLDLIKVKLQAEMEARLNLDTKADLEAKEWINLYGILMKFPGGDVSMIRPDGTVLGPFDGGKSIVGPWGIAIDGNDNIWVANSTGRSITNLCGARPENCPPGLKPGDPLSPPGGYIGGLQVLTDVAIDPAGNVWAANNWDQPEEGFKKKPDLAYSTRLGGNGVVVFFGLAKPVRTPLIGPVQAQ